MPEVIEHIKGYQSNEQRNLLLKIFSYEFSRNNLFLTGGTALSVFYATHRTSKDIDLFLIKEVNLLEYVRLLKDIGRVLTTISESTTFCSYIYEGGIKVDYVFDRFSASGNKKAAVIDGITINVDTVENIAINKICAVVSRAEPKDIIDLTWLFLNVFNPERDFIQLFNKATKREGLLEDLLYVKGVFNHIRQRSESILEVIHKALLQAFNYLQISEVFGFLEGLIDKLIKKKSA
ncbi:MAG: nucleotidyl transferase AbiEii/AbiGii toxin family protein [Nitrospirota bacterium]